MTYLEERLKEAEELQRKNKRFMAEYPGDPGLKIGQDAIEERVEDLKKRIDAEMEAKKKAKEEEDAREKPFVFRIGDYFHYVSNVLKSRRKEPLPDMTGLENYPLDALTAFVYQKYWKRKTSYTFIRIPFFRKIYIFSTRR